MEIPNYRRHLPPFKGHGRKRVVRNLKLPRHSAYIGHVWVKSCGKWIKPAIDSQIFCKGVKIAHAIIVYEMMESHQDKVLYRLWEGNTPLIKPPKPPGLSFDGESSPFGHD